MDFITEGFILCAWLGIDNGILVGSCDVVGICDVVGMDVGFILASKDGMDVRGKEECILGLIVGVGNGNNVPFCAIRGSLTYYTDIGS